MRRMGKPHLYQVDDGKWICSSCHYPEYCMSRSGYTPLDAYQQWQAAKEVQKVQIMASQRDSRATQHSRPMGTVAPIGTRLDQSGQSLSDLQVME